MGARKLQATQTGDNIASVEPEVETSQQSPIYTPATAYTSYWAWYGIQVDSIEGKHEQAGFPNSFTISVIASSDKKYHLQNIRDKVGIWQQVSQTGELWQKVDFSRTIFSHLQGQTDITCLNYWHYKSPLFTYGDCFKRQCKVKEKPHLFNYTYNDFYFTE